MSARHSERSEESRSALLQPTENSKAKMTNRSENTVSSSLEPTPLDSLSNFDLQFCILHSDFYISTLRPFAVTQGDTSRVGGMFA